MALILFASYLAFTSKSELYTIGTKEVEEIIIINHFAVIFIYRNDDVYGLIIIIGY